MLAINKLDSSIDQEYDVQRRRTGTASKFAKIRQYIRLSQYELSSIITLGSKLSII